MNIRFAWVAILSLASCTRSMPFEAEGDNPESVSIQEVRKKKKTVLLFGLSEEHPLLAGYALPNGSSARRSDLRIRAPWNPNDTLEPLPEPMMIDGQPYLMFDLLTQPDPNRPKPEPWPGDHWSTPQEALVSPTNDENVL